MEEAKDSSIPENLSVEIDQEITANVKRRGRGGNQ